MPLEHKGNLCQKERGKGEKRGGRERKRLSIFTEMDPLWLIKQVETFEQTGARKATNIYTKGLFNVSHRCYQGPLHLRLHVLQYKNRSVCQKVIYIVSIYITGCLFSGFLKKILRKNGLATISILFKRRPLLA